MNIYQTLQQYADSDRYPMHMPGHKRNPQFFMDNPYHIDVTEVEGTDDLHHPHEMIRAFMNRMRELYHTRESYILVNGSTCGILAAVSACCQRGDTIIMDRNCHRSVYHAVYLLHLQPIYLCRTEEEQTGIALGICPKQVKEILDAQEAACVILTSPTYEGVVSDIKEIADIVHEKDIPLIVDEAHGAHFAWHEKMPQTAMEQGADLVVESLHKTLPAFTQTAVLHQCTERVSKENLERYLDIYETSSPSYILIAGAAQCIQWMEENAQKAFREFFQYRGRFVKQASKWKRLSFWETSGQDPSKLIIWTTGAGMNGTELADRLRTQFHIETEMSAPEYVLAMTSICDTKEGWERLAQALTEIDRLAPGLTGTNTAPSFDRTEFTMKTGLTRQSIPKFVMASYDAVNHPYEQVLLEKSEGRISSEYAYVYPPGIPFLVPGEKIDRHILEKIKEAGKRGLNLYGMADENGKTIRVVL